jgi:hypothetical protein
MFSKTSEILNELKSARTEFDEAVELILCAVGQIDNLAMGMPSEKANKIRSAASSIFLACGIHDLAGERLDKTMDEMRAAVLGASFSLEEQIQQKWPQ